MAQGVVWSDWVDESPFEFRFCSPWLNYDDNGGPGTKVNFCGLKSIDFAVLPPANFDPALYLLEVKSVEWFDNGKGQLEDKICDLFRCYFDSLATLARSKDEAIIDFREAAAKGQIKLILFLSPRLPGEHNLMALMDGIRTRLAKKLKHLDVQPEVLIETLETVKRDNDLLFDVRHKS